MAKRRRASVVVPKEEQPLKDRDVLTNICKNHKFKSVQLNGDKGYVSLTVTGKFNEINDVQARLIIGHISEVLHNFSD